MITSIHKNSHFPFDSFRAVLKPSANSRQSCITESSLTRAKVLLDEMSLQEKLGQLHQVNSSVNHVSDDLAGQLRAGMIGSIINENQAHVIAQMQSIAINESRLGIPLLIGRDVIHGFATIFPLPIAMACSWNTEVVKKAARISAIEAANIGINWTFSPMIDISRDARWGRIAESFGEDTLLCGNLTVGMVTGYQTDDLSDPTAIAACAKHFVGYGASEAGRDYNTTNLSTHELRNIYMPPFKAACDAGVASVMTSFSDVNGVPVSGNKWLLNDVLRDQWKYDGVVVSDWESVGQLTIHGLAKNMYHAAYLGLEAGVDMEMVSGTFLEHGTALVENNHIAESQIDKAVLRILALKYSLGLFDNNPAEVPPYQDISEQAQKASYEAACQSCVLLKNDNKTLPLNNNEVEKIALIGYLADDPYEMLGTWIFDGDESKSVTLKASMQAYCESNNIALNYQPVFANSRDANQSEFESAFDCVATADHAVVVVGEESILSGEAHCRTDITLPGAQEELIHKLAESGTSITLVVMAGRPLILSGIVDKVDSILYAWHSGSMGGQAISDLLVGKVIPSGKLPVSFLRHVGQTPLYYGIKRTGRPVSEDTQVFMQDFPTRAPQTSLGMSSSHIDVHFTPLFVFGYGLSYSHFEYADISISNDTISGEENITVNITVNNTGEYDGVEIIQLYINDAVASQTRPVKELKKYKREFFKAGESKRISFDINIQDLAFYNDKGEFIAEDGLFTIWVGANSNAHHSVQLRLKI